MYRIVVLFLLLKTVLCMKAQQIEEFDSNEPNNWLDPDYEYFFSQPVIYSKKNDNINFTIIPTTNYNQGKPN